jgi:hypothetical protein
MTTRLCLSTVLAMVAVLGLTALGGVRRDELACEEAVARLIACCPKADPEEYQCFYKGGGCGSKEVLPELTEAESQAVIEADCQTLREERGCSIHGSSQ